MSAVGRRMNSLRSLSSVRNGPGAALLPPTITRLHLEFAHKHDNGHAGARKLWRDFLPALKYHNPAVPIIVNRTRDQSATPTLTIYHKDARSGSSGSSGSSSGTAAPRLLAVPADVKGGAIRAPKTAAAVVTDPWALIGSATDGSAPAPPPQSGEAVVTITMRNRMSEDIWAQLVAKTGAQAVEPSPEDVEEMERIAALRVQGEYDRRLQKARQDALKREKMILEKARQEADALKV